METVAVAAGMSASARKRRTRVSRVEGLAAGFEEEMPDSGSTGQNRLKVGVDRKLLVRLRELWVCP